MGIIPKDVPEQIQKTVNVIKFLSLIREKKYKSET